MDESTTAGSGLAPVYRDDPENPVPSESPVGDGA